MTWHMPVTEIESETQTKLQQVPDRAVCGTDTFQTFWFFRVNSKQSKWYEDVVLSWQEGLDQDCKDFSLVKPQSIGLVKPWRF